MQQVAWDQYVGYARNTLKGRVRRNQFNIAATAYDQGEQAKFRSELERERVHHSSSPYMNSSHSLNLNNFDSSSESAAGNSSTIDVVGTAMVQSHTALPAYYKLQEIRLSRLGIEDFDFAHFNKTPLASIENGHPQSFINAMVHMLIYAVPYPGLVNNGLGGHAVRDLLNMHSSSYRERKCQSDNCLVCELSNLSKMMNDAECNVQSTNFVRAYCAKE